MVEEISSIISQSVSNVVQNQLAAGWKNLLIYSNQCYFNVTCKHIVERGLKGKSMGYLKLGQSYNIVLALTSSFLTELL